MCFATEMGNCICASNNKVMSQEAEDDSRVPSAEDMKGTPSASLIKPPEEDRDERKKIKVEKKVRFKLEADDREEGRDPGNGGARRVRVVVTKEELRQILRHAKGSPHSSSSSGSSLEELLVALRSRGEERTGNGSDGKGDTYWRPGLESIPEHRRH